MTSALQTKNYERLDFYIDQIASDMDNAYGKFVECCRIAVEEEHLTPQEAWEYVYTKLKDHVAKSTLYLWGDKVLPEGSKKATKPRKIPTLESPKEETEFNTEGMGVIPDEDEPEPSSASSSATGKDGEQVEQEIEQPIYPDKKQILNVVGDLTIQDLKDEIAIKEAKLKELSEAVNKLTSENIHMQTEITLLRKELPKPEPTEEVPSSIRHVMAPHGILGQIVSLVRTTGGHGSLRFAVEGNTVIGAEVINFATATGQKEETTANL